tara:strand:+ start:617 stop:1591 length:975 start_codon:yes stop_codon:yes gene_type:complete
MTEPILIDTGRSPTGWSFWGSSFYCDQLWFITNVLQKQLIAADPLIQGSMGHTLLAHYYARVACKQGGLMYEGQEVTDPDYFLTPEQAVREWVRRRQHEGTEGAHFIANTLEVFRQYKLREPFVYDRVIGVEMLTKLTLGYNFDGDFGLWTDDNLRDPTLIDCPELPVPHPNVPAIYHGARIEMTKRWDLAMEHKQDGRQYVWDHKITGAGIGKTRAEQYAMDGQFAVNRLAGQQLLKNFGGVVLNLVQRRDPYGVSRQFVPATPFRDEQLPRQIFKKAHALAEMLAHTIKGDMGQGDWEMAQSELACYHRYGKCGAFDMCRFG